MADKIKVKLILELRAAHMSRNLIAKTRHMSKNSVSDVFHIADKLDITFNDVKDMSEEVVYRMFYPDKYTIELLYKEPDYEYVHKDLKKAGVTLKLLWQEYCDQCIQQNEISMGYTKYCRGYGDYTFYNKLTNHLNHKPGMVTEVDWSGPTMSFVEPSTGEIITAYLFVATLPYSQYSYVEPCLNMKQDTWLRCHINMYEFFDGVTVRTVCDNLKTGVIKHPKEGEIILNENYEALGSHYLTAIMPTGVRKPKQKASVEGTVGKVATAIIAKLRNEVYHSLDDLKDAIARELSSFNDSPFQKREGSRTEVFKEEKRYLRELPTIPYEIAEWIYRRKVYLDFHVVFEKNRYSCPYQYVGKLADLKVTDTKLEIYISGERISTHTRFPSYITDQYSTHSEDMPDQFLKPEWDDVAIRRWAYSIGSNASEVIERIFAGVKIKEQGYNPSLSVLRLSNTYSEARLETACELALTKVRTPRYYHLKAILSSNQDKVFIESKNISKGSTETSSGYVRGAEYYGGSNND
ncbi:MAG: IS21 family transposase [Bacilli bacterium]